MGDPLYATYEGVIRSTGADAVMVPLDPANGFHMRAADIEARITPRSRVLLLNTPHNPTGATLTAAEIAAIVAVCKRHDLWIVSDEVYEMLAYAGAFASPFDHPDGAERSIVVSSISKSHMLPGLPLRLVRRPEGLRRPSAAALRDDAVRRPALHRGRRRPRGRARARGVPRHGRDLRPPRAASCPRHWLRRPACLRQAGRRHVRHGRRGRHRARRPWVRLAPARRGEGLGHAGRLLRPAGAPAYPRQPVGRRRPCCARRRRGMARLAIRLTCDKAA